MAASLVGAGSGGGDAAMAALQAEVEDLRAELRGLQYSHSNVSTHLAAFEGDVARELGALRPMLRLVEHVHGRPWMSDPAALDIADRLGGVRLGYIEAADATDTRYADFEAVFRGTREQIAAKQQIYADLLAGCSPLLDLGCGRGEFLEVMAGRGEVARGVDLDESMVAEATHLGLDARVGDLFDELETHADDSVEGIFSAQVIEHLLPRDMSRFLEEIHRVLAPSGLAVIETVNPHSLRAMRFFWLDLTHTMPVYPESALSLARGAGFPAACIVFPGGYADLAQSLAEDGDFALVVAKSSQRLRDAELVG